ARLRLAVTDTGIGIPAEARDRLFTPFSQVDGTIARRFGGTGLGLAICKRLVELMDGSIRVDSAPGRGSTFTLSLPLVLAEAPAFAAAPEAPPLPPLSILLAEDNLVNQKVAKATLERHGHRVVIVGDGFEAVDIITRSPPDRFQVVLMDVQMPHLDGLQATARIRALPPPRNALPVIAMTANALKGDAERCLAAGMDGYIPKPMVPAPLFAEIARVLGMAQSNPVAAPQNQGGRRVLDHQALDALIEAVGRESIGEVLDSVLAHIARASDALAEAAGDAERIGFLAHDLKSASQSVGLEALATQARRVETAWRAGRPADALALAEALPLLIDEAMEVLGPMAAAG
ncbi:MAG: ATP-binding protein, partial [Pseudomonadota bacterium]